MTVILDAPTEQRIQRELARTGYRTPAELIAHALDLVAAEEDWLTRNRDAIRADMEDAFAQDERGEGCSSEDFMHQLVAQRAARAA